MRWLFLWAWAFGLIGSQAFAQTAAPKPQSSRLFTTYVVPGGAGEAPALVYLRGEQAVDLATKGNRRSDATPWPGAGAMRLAMRNPRPAAGAPAYLPIADLAWPGAEADRALVVVVFGQANQAPKAYVLADDAKSFPVNTARVLNVTGVPLMVRVNAFSSEVAMGGATPAVPYPEVRDLAPGAMVRYPFGLAIRRNGDEPLVLNSGFQEGVPGTRALFVVTPPAQAGSTKVRVRNLIDRPAADRPAPAAAR